ncbi:MAG: IS4 family transposase, partial [Prevotella sp.]|nr:IS4 family transposase [Prevotella sp.]
RLNDYETMGALFEQQRADLMALTLWQRLLAIIKHLLEVLADVLGVTCEELSASIVRDEKMLGKYIVMAEALKKLDEAA